MRLVVVVVVVVVAVVLVYLDRLGSRIVNGSVM